MTAVWKKSVLGGLDHKYGLVKEAAERRNRWRRLQGRPALPHYGTFTGNVTMLLT